MERERTEKHILGGRTFLAIRESTIEQDFHFLALVKQARIDEITMGPDERPEDFARRLLEITVASGKTLDLLGCLLIPEDAIEKGQEPGDAWTRRIGDETAAFLGRLKTPADKAKLRTLVLSLIISFFENGIVSLWTSKTSSQEAIPSTRENGTSPGATDRGPSSSANLQTAITTAPKGSSDGPCASRSSHTGEG